MTRATARHGLKARKTSPKATLTTTKPSQTVTKAKVTEKFRSGASVPLSPDQIVTPSRKTPSAPQTISTPRLSRAREIQERRGRQVSSSNRVACQAIERAKKETTRTAEAAQANSHSGIGRSWRPTRAWPTTSRGAASPDKLSSDRR